MISGTHASLLCALISSLAIWGTLAADIRRRSRDSARFAHIRELRHR
jgi:hypothetical protein